MKKLALVLMLLLTICLTGCTSDKRVAIIDTPAADINTALNLDLVKSGKSINSEIDKSGNFYDVKVATDAKASLFYDVIDLDDYLNKSFKGINVNVLLFNNKVGNDIINFIAEINNKNYGITEESIGFDFATDNNSGVFFKSVALSNNVKSPEGYDTSAEKENALVVVYLPVYCIYTENNTDYTKIFMLVPVYYSYTYVTDSIVEDVNVKGMTNYKIILDENNLLPNAE